MLARVGMPQGLLHYNYGILWERFFQELGLEVIKSGETTRATLDCGSALDEICLPAKVYYGHAAKLNNQVDYLFAPRVISVNKGQYTCPKIIGMPDMLRNNISGMPPVIDVNVNLRQSSRNLYEAVAAIGKIVGKGKVASLYAWYKAWQHRNQPISKYSGRVDGPQVALIGHPYLIYDRQISMNVIEKLRHMGINVVTPEMVNASEVAQASKTLGKKIFWSSSHHLAGAAIALLTAKRPVDGVIFMTCFACGPDALIGELISQRAQSINIPCMQLSIDEHTAEAGFITRLEAFTDMLTRRWPL
ncbi:acyl-CoA dehydratase activase-related protein [Dendrosporobacter sp. 1207_IL3150]|uniref:acyl-CoA dehydratase activase-related protein n=1 Tax=Dendrosporobacter sp. 1207_IL3150 TaxID=3084054 RepID=UPI002FD928B1